MNDNCPILQQYGVRATWDHDANASHVCQFCKTEIPIVTVNGRRIRVTDQGRRNVTILRTIPVQGAAPRPAVPLATLQRSALAYQGCPPSGWTTRR